jgi:hypothetical protein
MKCCIFKTCAIWKTWELDNCEWDKNKLKNVKFEHLIDRVRLAVDKMRYFLKVQNQQRVCSESQQSIEKSIYKTMNSIVLPLVDNAKCLKRKRISTQKMKQTILFSKRYVPGTFNCERM